MFCLRKILFVIGLLFLAASSFSAHFDIKPFQVIGTNDDLFMSKFSGANYYNPSKTRLLIACSNGTFTMVATAGEEAILPFSKTHQAYTREGVKYVNFSPSGDRIVSTSTSGIVKVWDLEFNLLSTLEDFDDKIHLATFGDNDDEIFTNSMGNINKLWKIVNNKSTL